MKSVLGVSIIAIAMGWSATMTIPAATVAPAEATLKLLPPETAAVAFIDAASLRSAPLWRDALASKTIPFDKNRNLAEFMSATGFDPQRDLDHVTVAKIGAGQMLLIAQGRFDRLKLEQFVKDKSTGRISSEAYMGRTIYLERDKAFSLIDNLVIAGNRNAVRKVITQMSLPGSVPLPADLMSSIGQIEAGSQVWAVGDFSFSDLPAELRGPAPALEIMKSLRSGTYQMRVDQDLHAKAVGNFEQPDAARDLSDLARGFIAIARMQIAKEEPDLALMLDGIQVSNTGSTVVVNIDQRGDLLRKLPQFK